MVEYKNVMDKNRRFKRLFLFAMLAFMLVSRFIIAFATHAPLQTRRLMIIGAMALFMLPLGFIYGRNSGRRDQLGKIARFFLVLMILGLCVGSVFGGKLAMLDGLGGGYLAGYLIGGRVWRRAREEYGDTPEADQVMNVTRSEHIPPKEHPCETYLKSQDPATRRAIWTLRITELLMAFGALGLGLWSVFADWFDTLSRAIFVHPGDGTVYFITTDPIVIAVPLIMLSICVCGVVSELLLPLFAGTRRDIWIEFKRLRSTKRGSVACNKPIVTYAFAVFVLALISAVFLFVDSYVKVTHDGVELNRYWRLGAESYRWTDVRVVDSHQEQYACRKCGQQHQRFYAKVVFTDDSEWKPDTSFGRRESQIENAVRYVAVRKGL